MLSGALGSIAFNGKGMGAKKKTIRLDGLTSFDLWELRDSNPRPSACKADALNQLSYAPK